MKKQILLMTLLSSLAYSSSVKSDVLIKNEGGKTLIIYRPLDLKINSKDNKYTFFTKIRGTRSTDGAEYVEIVKRVEPDKIEKFDTKKEVKTDRLDKSFPQNVFEHYHGPHEHDNALNEHDHMFDENEIEHTHDPNLLVLSYPKFKEKIQKPTDFQIKLGAIYQPNRYTFARLTYMPTTYNGDERLYYNSAIIDGQYTHLFNDDLALILRPMFTINPNILENRIDLRYRIKPDAFLKLNTYSGLQINDIDEIINVLNSVEFTYDYNKEKRRVHPFYEILDHEHEKIEQTKISLRLAHNGRYYNNPVLNQNTKFDRLVNVYDAKLSFVYKKPINDFILETKLDINENIKTDQRNGRAYEITNAALDKDIDENKLKTTRVFTSKKQYNDDFSEYIKVGKRNINKKEQVIIEKGKSTNPTDYEPKIVLENMLKVNNDTSLTYKNFKVRNKLKVDYNVLKKQIDKMKDNISLEYKQNLDYGFSITPKVEYMYSYKMPSNTLLYSDPEIEKELSVLADLAYNYRNAKVRVRAGIEPGFKNKNFVITPYAKIKYNITDNLQTFVDSKIVYEKELKSVNLNIGLKYNW